MPPVIANLTGGSKVLKSSTLSTRKSPCAVTWPFCKGVSSRELNLYVASYWKRRLGTGKKKVARLSDSDEDHDS